MPGLLAALSLLATACKLCIHRHLATSVCPVVFVSHVSSLVLIQARELPRPVPVTVVRLGDAVTMKCSVSKEKLGLFYWYKLNFVFLIQTIAEETFGHISLKGEFNTSRFTLTKADSDYLLNIKNVSKDDEATYFCQTGSAYMMTVHDGTVLAVTGKLLSVHRLMLLTLQLNCLLSLRHEGDRNQTSVYLRQSPEAALMAPGDSVEIHCSLLTTHTGITAQCPGGRSVYWFRSGSGGFTSSIMYVQKSRSHDQRSCVYTFTKTVQDSSDAGTYYCAVVTCGEILFGEGTRVETSIIIITTIKRTAFINMVHLYYYYYYIITWNRLLI